MLPPSGSSCQSAPEVDVSVVIIIFPLWCLGLVADEGRSLGIPCVLSCNYGVTCWRSPNMASQGNSLHGRVNIPQRKNPLSPPPHSKKYKRRHILCLNCFFVCFFPPKICEHDWLFVISWMRHNVYINFNLCITHSLFLLVFIQFMKLMVLYLIYRHKLI